MKKVYGYIRVSTAKQGEGVSLIEQKEAIIRYAGHNSLNIVQWFEEKETAAKQGRPLFTAMMKLLRDRKAIGVVIHKIDRSARNLKDWSDLGNLIDQGIEVHFAHESLDLQARSGRLSADIQAVIAADYIRNLRQEAIKGIYGRLKQGIYPFQAPVGYLDMGKGKFKTVDPIQGPLVRKAFELYATRKYTLHTLLVYMHKMGLRNLKQNKVSLNGLSKILNNSFYAGIIKVKGVTFRGGHEPLIPSELFKRVQAILRGKTNQKIFKHDFKFRKLLKCKVCGYSLIGEKQKGYMYYRCHTKNCPTKSIRETLVENRFVNTLCSIQLLPEESIVLDKLYEETEKHREVVQAELLNSLKLKAGQLEQRLERLTDCYVEGGLDKETYEHRKTKLFFELGGNKDSERALLANHEKVLKRTKKFLEYTKRIKNSYENAIFEEQREMIQTVTSNFSIDGKKPIILLRSPFMELSNRSNFSFGEAARDTPWKKNTIIDFSDTTTPHLSTEPLSEEKLRSLFQLILDSIEKLPGHEDDDSLLLGDP